MGGKHDGEKGRMSRNGGGGRKKDEETEEEGNRGQGRMRRGTMMDRFLASSICHAVIGRKME